VNKREEGGIGREGRKKGASATKKMKRKARKEIGRGVAI